MISDPDIDLIDCGTRPNIRHAMVLSALKNGKHVYNGIPFAADFVRAREIYQSWKHSNSVAVVDAYCEWLPALQAAKSLLDKRELGALFGGICTFNMGLFNQPDSRFPYNWFSQKGTGVSAVRNLGSHALHMLYHLFGEVDELVADQTIQLKQWVFPDGSSLTPNNEDVANVILKFKCGLIMPFQVSWSASLGPGWFLEAYGSDGRLEMRAPSFPTPNETSLKAGKLGGAMEEVDLAQFKSSGFSPEFQPQAASTMAVSMTNMVASIEGKQERIQISSRHGKLSVFRKRLESHGRASVG